MRVEVEALGSGLIVVGPLSTSFFRDDLPLLGGLRYTLASSGSRFDGGDGSFGGRESTNVTIGCDVPFLIDLSYFSCRCGRVS